MSFCWWLDDDIATGLRENPESLVRYFVVTWITSVALALVVLGITFSLEQFDLIEGIENGGEDAAMRFYADSERDLSRQIVVVNIDNQTRRMWEDAKSSVGERLPDLVHLVTGQGKVPARAKAIVLDLELAEGVSDQAKTRLTNEFKNAPHVRVVAPFQSLRQTHGNNEWEAGRDWIDDLAVGEKSANVVRAAALLKADESDGVVRHLTRHVCVFRPMSKSDGRWLHVPTLAEAAAGKEPQEETPCNPEEANDERLVILFKHDHHDAGVIRTVSASELLDKNGNSLSFGSRPVWDGAYVVIGQTDAEASADQHRTALGMIPGDLVTANEIFTVAKGKQKLGDKLLYELILLLLLGLLFAWMRTAIEWIHPKDMEPNQCDNAPVSFEWKRPLFELGGLVLYFSVVLAGLALAWTYMASRALAVGIVFGTFVPVLGVALEALTEIGEILISLFRDVAGRLYDIFWPSLAKAKSGAIAVVALLAMLHSGRAEKLVGWLILNDVNANVTILRAGKSALQVGKSATSQALRWELRPFDTVRVGSGTEVTVEWPDRSETLHGPDTLYIGPPLRTGPGADWWEKFWGQPFTRGETYTQGITVVSRGVHGVPSSDPAAVLAAGGDIARALPVAGPLRLPSAFPKAAYLTAERPGLALAWSGGTPPYDIVAEDEGGATIAEFNSETTFLWQPEWRAPNAPTRLRIADANDRVLRIEIKPSSPRPSAPGVDPLADAIDLFETEPAWQFEALRRIARLAALDPTAVRAVLAIRLAE